MSAEGVQPGQRGLRGLLRPAEERVFHRRDWRGVTPGEFEEGLGEYLEYYCEGRLKKSLGWMSPNEYRRSLGYAA